MDVLSALCSFGIILPLLFSHRPPDEDIADLQGGLADTVLLFCRENPITGHFIQRPEKGSFHDSWSKVFPDQAPLLPFDDYGANQVKIFDKRFVYIFLHELAALPYLHSQNFTQMLLFGDN